jgi:FkbM family methyltransferase
VGWIEERVRPGMRVADVGANAGSLTRRFLEQGAVVTAIEPHPEMAAKLR